MREIQIGNQPVGPGEPAYVIGEIGINHNGDVDIAKELIDVAEWAGCDAVKFQKRDPEVCVPEDQKDVPRETPWGVIPYIEYKHKIEFGEEEFREIDRYCRDKDIDWFASAWDLPSLDLLKGFDMPAHKVPSAMLAHHDLLERMGRSGKPVLLSTGMSTMDQIREAVGAIGEDNLAILHCTSTYPCDPEELNLSVIDTLQREFDCPVGYSGHEVGLQTTLAAVTLGACIVERHITLDRAMWGSDQAASIEPQGLERLVRDIRVIERAMGDGEKKVYESEKPARQRLRGSRFESGSN